MRMSVQNQLMVQAALKSEAPEAQKEVAAQLPLEKLPLTEAQAALCLRLVTAENFDENYAALENWNPSERKTPEENVQDLRERYASLKSYLLRAAPAEQYETMLAQLEALILQHIEALMRQQYGDLTGLLLDSKQDTAVFMIKNSLLFFVLGKASPESPHWPEGFCIPKNVSPGAQRGSPPPFLAETDGMLHYDRHSLVQLSQNTNRSSDPKGHAPLDKNAVKYTAAGAAKAPFPRPFTPAELEASNRFSKHLHQHRAALPGAAAGLEKEEWIGFQTGLIWLKGQLFAALPGISPTMAHVMQNAIDYQNAAWVHHLSAVLKHEAKTAPPMRFAPLDHKAVFSISNRMMQHFLQSRDVKKSIMSCLFYMLEVLKKKEADPEYQRMQRYQAADAAKNDEAAPHHKPENGFGSDTKFRLQKEKQSWNAFVKDMHLPADICLDFSRFQEQSSAWLYDPPPKTTRHTLPLASPATVLGWCGVGLIALFVLALLTGLR